MISEREDWANLHLIKRDFMKTYEKDLSKIKNKIEGSIGEIDAVKFLKQKKYRILETNYKNKIGEIDIIAEFEQKIIFVEVKRRSTLAYGRPSEAVDFRKQNKIKKVAEIYLMMKNKYYSDVRFDVIEIIDQKITHLENAFE